MLNKNSFWIGIISGLVSAVIAEGLVFGTNFLLTLAFGLPMLAMKKMFFAAAALNILAIRYVYVTLSLEKTGMGILFITVVLVIAVTLFVR